MAERIEELLSSFNEFKAVQIATQQAQEKNQQDLAAKFDQLQKEVVAGQEETAQMMAKKLKRGPDYQFRHIGNEKQRLSAMPFSRHQLSWRRSSHQPCRTLLC